MLVVDIARNGKLVSRVRPSKVTAVVVKTSEPAAQKKSVDSQMPEIRDQQQQREVPDDDAVVADAVGAVSNCHHHYCCCR